MSVWGTSFDDGPSESTPIVLDWFARAGFKTSFWVIGTNVVGYPDILNRTFHEGHQIASHTWSHRDLKKLSDDEIVSELVYGIMAIRTVTGKTPKYYRPPMGSMDERVQAIAGMMGLTSTLWSQDSQDWTYVDKPEMGNVLTAFQKWMDEGVQGAISLEHDLWSDTSRVGMQAMEILVRNNRTIVPVSDCLRDPTPYNNTILEGFFQSGQFTEHERVLPFRLADFPSTVRMTATATASATASVSATRQAEVTKGFANWTSSQGSVGTVATANSNLDSPGRGPMLSSGAIAGIAVGSAAGAALLVIAAVLLVRWDHAKRVSKQNQKTSPASESDSFLTA
ncbi:chitin deacetylase [Chytriomyces hyalinus]|nr:chitin deacetylase [Chytriomyces hyalinus]